MDTALAAQTLEKILLIIDLKGELVALASASSSTLI